MSALTIEKSSFESEVLQAEQPVLVYFWATWCGTCKVMSPRIEALAGQSAGRFKVVKVEVGSAPELAEQYNVLSLPTTLLFKLGAPPKEIILSAYNKDWTGFIIEKHLT